MKTINEYISGNAYPGRGILIGKPAEGKAMIAYFISGRSENSRNRVFEVDEKGHVYTKPFDVSKVEDPSLIIYRAIADIDDKLIVTNGDQTDTIYDALASGQDSRDGLRTRCFEPDGPNWTPRISGVLTFAEGDFTYEMSILKAADAEGSACSRYFYEYAPLTGCGHIIHTYEGDGNPLPTFYGEPRKIAVKDDIDAMTEEIWNSLNADNKISLYVRYMDLATGAVETRLINKNK